jgi:La domain
MTTSQTPTFHHSVEQWTTTATTVTTATPQQASPPHPMMNSSPIEAIRTLISRLRLQIEYYFSPANMARDIFLRNVMASNDGSVPVNVIAGFPKIRALCSLALRSPVKETVPINWVIAAVKTSMVVTLNADQTLIQLIGDGIGMEHDSLSSSMRSLSFNSGGSTYPVSRPAAGVDMTDEPMYSPTGVRFAFNPLLHHCAPPHPYPIPPPQSGEGFVSNCHAPGIPLSPTHGYCYIVPTQHASLRPFQTIGDSSSSATTVLVRRKKKRPTRRDKPNLDNSASSDPCSSNSRSSNSQSPISWKPDDLSCATTAPSVSSLSTTTTPTKNRRRRSRKRVGRKNKPTSVYSESPASGLAETDFPVLGGSMPLPQHQMGWAEPPDVLLGRNVVASSLLLSSSLSLSSAME